MELYIMAAFVKKKKNYEKLWLQNRVLGFKNGILISQNA